MSDATTVQTRLAALGLYTGRIDGIIGPASLRAILAALDGMGGRLTGELEPAAGIDDETRRLIAELEREEGRVLHAYQDHLGFWTIGIGRLIDGRKGGGITNAEADALLANDIAKVRAQLDAALPWWRTLNAVRQRALCNMVFQMGINGVLGFTGSLPLIQAGKWAEAGRNLRKSLWAKQTPARAERVIQMIEKGVA